MRSVMETIYDSLFLRVICVRWYKLRPRRIINMYCKELRENASAVNGINKRLDFPLKCQRGYALFIFNFRESEYCSCWGWIFPPPDGKNWRYEENGVRFDAGSCSVLNETNSLRYFGIGGGDRTEILYMFSKLAAALQCNAGCRMSRRS
jgi:hypothetical protein